MGQIIAGLSFKWKDNMKIVRHRLYVAYLLTPLLLPYLCFYFCNKLINSDFENSGGDNISLSNSSGTGPIETFSAIG